MKLPPRVVQLFRLTRPLFLLGGIVMYALGAGIAHYLGTTINWNLYWAGQVCVLLLQLAGQLLNEYFDHPADRHNANRTALTGGSGVVGEEGGVPKRVVLWVALALLAGVGGFLTLLAGAGSLTGGVLIIAGLSVVLAIFYSVPPLRLVSSGYGELTTSLLVANLVPAFAFLLQRGEDHRLLGMATFPLLFLHLAMMLAFDLPDYAADLKYQKRTLMVRVGWQRGMLLHNLFIVTAYVAIALAIVRGMPFRIIWSLLLTLPLAVFQIWQMNRIAAGAKPRWSLLTWGALALLALAAYLLMIGFWLN